MIKEALELEIGWHGEVWGVDAKPIEGIRVVLGVKMYSVKLKLNSVVELRFGLGKNCRIQSIPTSCHVLRFHHMGMDCIMILSAINDCG